MLTPIRFHYEYSHHDGTADGFTGSSNCSNMAIMTIMMLLMVILLLLLLMMMKIMMMPIHGKRPPRGHGRKQRDTALKLIASRFANTQNGGSC